MFQNFHMHSNPFAEQPPVGTIQKDDRFTQGLARMNYFLTEGILALLIGMTGVGKTSLLKLFMHSLPRNKVVLVAMHMTNISAKGILRMLVHGLGEVPKIGKDRLFLQIMDKTTKSDLPILVVIDEAHLLPSEALIDLRLLVSGTQDKALKIILCGQDCLRNRLRQDNHADLAHRINVAYALHPLTKEQTVAYIDDRVRSCGGPEKLIDSEAKYLIHEYARGIPRQINKVATACLLNAATKKEPRITENIVELTISEIFLT
jgi:general secretion pathway protein A